MIDLLHIKLHYTSRCWYFCTYRMYTIHTCARAVNLQKFRSRWGHTDRWMFGTALHYWCAIFVSPEYVSLTAPKSVSIALDNCCRCKCRQERSQQQNAVCPHLGTDALNINYQKNEKNKKQKLNTNKAHVQRGMPKKITFFVIIEMIAMAMIMIVHNFSLKFTRFFLCARAHTVPDIILHCWPLSKRVFKMNDVCFSSSFFLFLF